MAEEEEIVKENNSGDIPEIYANNVELIVQLQLQEYHHLQSMSRGWLGVILAILAISIAGISAFYNPIPSIPTNAADYQQVIDDVPLAIGVNVALFTMGISLLMFYAILSLGLASLGISIKNFLEILVPAESPITETVGRITNGSAREAINKNKDTIVECREQYIEGSLRIIIGIGLVGYSFMIYNWMASQQIWILLWLSVITFIPSPIWIRSLEKFSSSAPNIERDNGPTPSLLHEFITEEGNRIEKLETRGYENWLIGLTYLLSFLVISAWIISILAHII